MTKVYCSETAVARVYDCMRVVGIASYTRDLAPLERLMRDAMVFPLYDGGNHGVLAASCTTSSASPDTTRCSPPAAWCHPGNGDTGVPGRPARRPGAQAVRAGSGEMGIERWLACLDSV